MPWTGLAKMSRFGLTKMRASAQNGDCRKATHPSPCPVLEIRRIANGNQTWPISNGGAAV